MTTNEDEVYGSGTAVKINPSYVALIAFRKIVRGALSIIVILALIYTVVFVPTAARYLVTQQFGIVLTKDPTIRNSGIPKGKVELVEIGSNRKMMDSAWGKVKAGFTYHSDVSKVKIYAGPGGRVRVDDDSDNVYLNNKPLKQATKPINYDDLSKDRGWMRGQYLVQCMDGACKKGSWYIIKSGDVIGELKEAQTSEEEN